MVVSLSGKKFKAPDFIKKHIFNKFPDELEKVKLETEFYNNYNRDPGRPELPEHPPRQPLQTQTNSIQFRNQAGVTKVNLHNSVKHLSEYDKY